MANKYYATNKWFANLTGGSTSSNEGFRKKENIKSVSGVTISNESIYKTDKYYVNQEDISYQTPLKQITISIDSGISYVTRNGSTTQYHNGDIILVDEGSSITLTAVAKSGYSVTSTNPLTVTADANKTVSFTSKPNTVYYKVYRSLDSNTSSITINGTSYTTSDTSSGIQFASGTTISWSVSVKSGYQIKSVTVGGTTYTASSGSFTLSSDTTITVTTETVPTTYYTLKWTLPSYGVSSITIYVGGVSKGTFTSSSTTSTLISVAKGSTVTYSLAAATGYNSPTGSPASNFTMDADKTITVTSGPIKTYTFKYTKDSNVSSVSIKWNGGTAETYTDTTKTFTKDYGTKIELDAVATQDHVIASGAPFTVSSLTKNEETNIISKEREKGTFTFSWTVDNGVLSFQVNDEDYGSNSDRISVTEGNSVTWKAIPKPGYIINGASSGTISSMSKDESVTITTTRNIYKFSWTFDSNFSDIMINDQEEAYSPGYVTCYYNDIINWEMTINRNYYELDGGDDWSGNVIIMNDVSKTFKSKNKEVRIDWDDLPEGVKSITIKSSYESVPHTFNRGGLRSVIVNAAPMVTWSLELEDHYEVITGSKSGSFRNCFSDKTISLPTVDLEKVSLDVVLDEGVKSLTIIWDDRGETNSIENIEVSTTLNLPYNSFMSCNYDLKDGYEINRVILDPGPRLIKEVNTLKIVTQKKAVEAPAALYPYPDYTGIFPNVTLLLLLDINFNNLSVSTIVSSTELTNLKLSFVPEEFSLNNGASSFTAGIAFSNKTVTISSAGTILNFMLSSYAATCPQQTTDDWELPSWKPGSKVISGLFTLSYTYKNNTVNTYHYIDTEGDLT